MYKVMPRFPKLSSVSALTIAFALAGGLNASAQNRVRTLTDYSVTNWAEAEGPFPLGIDAVAQDREGFLWLAARTGLVRFDGVNFVVWNERVPLPKERVSTICASKDGAIWVGFETREGISRVYEGGVSNFGPDDGLVGGYILTLLEDKSGTIWAGGYGGLSRFRAGRWQSIAPVQGLPAVT